MKSMIQGELYPTSLHDDDNQMYIAYLSMILSQREELEYMRHHTETHEELVASMPSS